MPDEPRITPRPNSSYHVENVSNLIDSRGEKIKTGRSFELCACGASGHKPFCDGTHREIGFSTEKKPDRKPDKVKIFEGEKITIYDNPGLCTRVGLCRKYSPEVFNGDRESWAHPDAADPEKTAATIRMCPSGALMYSLKGVLEQITREPTITIEKNGPYNVTGGIKLEGPEGCTPGTEEHYSLCRCGASKNKPFCDGSHWEIDFRDDKN